MAEDTSQTTVEQTWLQTDTTSVAPSTGAVSGSVYPSATSNTPKLHPNRNPEEDLNILIWKLALTVAVCLALFIGSLVILVTIAYSRRKAARKSEPSSVSDSFTYQNPSDVLLDENESFQDIDANGNNNGSVHAPGGTTPTLPECRTPIYLPGVHTLQPITEELPAPRPSPLATQKLNSAPFNIQNYQTSTGEGKSKQVYVTLEV